MTALVASIGFPEDLVDRLVDERRSVVAGEARCVGLVAEMIRCETHEDLGYRSLTSLLIDRLGLSAGVARGMIRTARALVEMPHTLEAFTAGELDAGRVRLLIEARETAPEVFAAYEQTLVDTTGGLSMRDARRAVEYWSQQAALEAVEADARKVRERRRLFVSESGGMVHVDGRLDPVAGQVVITALNSLTDPGNLDPEDTRTAAQRRADALVTLCRDHLDHGDLPRQRTERPHVMVHVSLEALEGRAGRPCELQDGGVITPEAARRLACDAMVTRVITRGQSQVLDVGRTTRVVPRGLRLALVARDRGCVIPGCGVPARWCDAHHVIHWANGGLTRLEDLRLVCDRHHTLVHEGKIQLPALE